MYREHDLRQKQEIKDIYSTSERQLLQIQKQNELDALRLQEELNNNKISFEEMTRQKNQALNEQQDLILQKKGQLNIIVQQKHQLKEQQYLLEQTKSAEELAKIHLNHRVELSALSQRNMIEQENMANAKHNSEI